MAVTAMSALEPDDNDEVLEFDVNSLTLGEVEEMEEIVGGEVMRQLGDGAPSVKTLVALVYVMKRRTNPDYSLDDARKMKVAAIKAEAAGDPKENGD